MRTKPCTGTCGRVLPLTDFHVNNARKDAHQNQCKDCRAVYSRRRYRGVLKKDPSWYAATRSMVKRRQRRARDFIQHLKNHRGCLMCGEREPACLDFHHLDPDTKHLKVSSMAGRCLSRATIVAEIKKCVVLCGNCHRRTHAASGTRTPRPAIARVNAIKRRTGCMVCGITDFVCLDMHHLCPETKAADVSVLACRRTTSPAKLMAELAKCVVLCVNCHRQHHAGYFPLCRRDLVRLEPADYHPYESGGV